MAEDENERGEAARGADALQRPCEQRRRLGGRKGRREVGVRTRDEARGEGVAQELLGDRRVADEDEARERKGEGRSEGDAPERREGRTLPRERAAREEAAHTPEARDFARVRRVVSLDEDGARARALGRERHLALAPDGHIAYREAEEASDPERL